MQIADAIPRTYVVLLYQCHIVLDDVEIKREERRRGVTSVYRDYGTTSTSTAYHVNIETTLTLLMEMI